MLANAAEFRLARMGCWSAAVTTEVLLPATRLAWYKVAAGASSEPPVASSWAPIGAEGPWSPSDEATLTASSFSGGPKTALLRLAPPPPPPPPPPLPIAIGEHVLTRRFRRYRLSLAVHDVARNTAHVHSTACTFVLLPRDQHCRADTRLWHCAHLTFMSFPLESFLRLCAVCMHPARAFDTIITHKMYILSISLI